MTRFPHKEDSAGKLRDKHETGKSSEALLADDPILALAKTLLDKDEYSEAEKLAKMLTQSNKVRDAARVRLLSVLKPPPKRPIYYLEREILSLPRWTRNAMRFLGDYVDMLVKAAAFDVIRNDRILYNVSLGPAIRYFEKAYPGETDLARQLGRVHTKQGIGDKGEVDKKHKHHVEFIESREDSTITFQSSEKPLYLISLLVHLPIIFPCKNPVCFGRYHRNHA